jgi:hypothetical protein
MNEEAEVKRGPGRPKKEEKAPPKYKMKAKPNWEEIDPNTEDTPDRLRIPVEMWPEGLSLQWVTDSVLGQSMGQHRAIFERTGWTPVHQSDFDGKFDGMFMPRGAEGEIKYEGLVLMARPLEMTLKAKREDQKRAREQIEIKERALRGGDIPNVSLDAQHESALKTNKVSKSYERIAVPED